MIGHPGPLYFATGIVVTVAPATGRKPAGATRFACPSCGTEHDIVVTGGPQPADLRLDCLGCDWVGSVS